MFCAYNAGYIYARMCPHSKRGLGMGRWYSVLPFISVYVIINSLCPQHSISTYTVNQDLWIRLFWERSITFAPTAFSLIKSTSSGRNYTTIWCIAASTLVIISDITCIFEVICISGTIFVDKLALVHCIFFFYCRTLKTWTDVRYVT